MVSMSFAVLASAQTSVDAPAVQGAYGNWQTHYEALELNRHHGMDPPTTNALDVPFAAEDGPYPEMQDDGRPKGAAAMSVDPVEASATPYGHYISEKFWYVPYGPGGGWSLEATGGMGNIGVGSSNEYYIGDQNGNGVQEWISYYADKRWFTDGIDNDGDGCVDEKSYGDYLGMTCGNNLPDGFVYFETGVKPDAGGDMGDLLVLSDWYGSVQSTKIWRIGVSPPWGGYVIRGYSYYPQMAGDFVQFQTSESYFGVNVNAATGDTDLYDQMVAGIDARGFPLNPPTLHFCAAGGLIPMGSIARMESGLVVGAYETYEGNDNYKDWNKDGDTYDYVVMYYYHDLVTGACNKGVNTQVYGWYPRVSAELITPGYTWEGNDRRDWTGDGDTFDTVTVYHEIASSLALAGTVYTSYTWTAPRQPWGFGYTGAALPYSWSHLYPLNFGGTVEKYVGSALGSYQTAMFLTGDDDGIQNTLLPEYLIGYGQPMNVPGFQCIGMYQREWYLEGAGLKLIGGHADANGDGDYLSYHPGLPDPYGGDTTSTMFCPDETGGTGQWVREPTSKNEMGYYTDDFPAIRAGYGFFAADGMDVSGWVIMPLYWVEGYSSTYYGSMMDDANGDLLINGKFGGYDEWFTTWDWMMMGKADFEIMEVEILGDVQPGGTVVARLKLQNTGGIDLEVPEDEGIENDRGYKLQGLAGRDTIGPDGIIQPQETATVYITLTVSAGEDLGMIPVKIFVTMFGTTKEATVEIPVILKMFGDDLSCYRHKQNALRTLRAFDMDDDEGMLHNLEVDDEVIVGDQNMLPEDAVLLLLSWFEVGCKVGHENVERAHSASASLTGHYGMGMQYWGFAPGQEEGNEGNGNGGLTGQARKDVYGF